MSDLVKEGGNTSNGSQPTEYCLNRTQASPNWGGKHMTARGKNAPSDFSRTSKMQKMSRKILLDFSIMHFISICRSLSEGGQLRQ